jgi:hypothetical protein
MKKNQRDGLKFKMQEQRRVLDERRELRKNERSQHTLKFNQALEQKLSQLFPSISSSPA